jgi:hypothetical protein
VKVKGLVGVPDPATVKAVVPSVSVNTPVPLALIWLPFRSVAVPAPVEDINGAFRTAPELEVTVAEGLPSAVSV